MIILRCGFFRFILGDFDAIRGKKVLENLASSVPPQYITNHGTYCNTYRRYSLKTSNKRYKFAWMYLPGYLRIYDVEIISDGQPIQTRVGSNGYWGHNAKCGATTCYHYGNRIIFGRGTDQWTVLCHVKAYAKLFLRPGMYKFSFL